MFWTVTGSCDPDHRPDVQLHGGSFCVRGFLPCGGVFLSQAFHKRAASVTRLHQTAQHLNIVSQHVVLSSEKLPDAGSTFQPVGFEKTGVCRVSPGPAGPMRPSSRRPRDPARCRAFRPRRYPSLAGPVHVPRMAVSSGASCAMAGASSRTTTCTASEKGLCLGQHLLQHNALPGGCDASAPGAAAQAPAEGR